MNILRTSSHASLRLLSFDESSSSPAAFSTTPIKSRIHEDSEHLLHTDNDTDSECDDSSNDHHSECSLPGVQEPSRSVIAAPIPTSLQFPINLKKKKAQLVRYETVLQQDEEDVTALESADNSTTSSTAFALDCNTVTTNHILELPHDAQIAIASFLDLSSLQSMMKVNHACRQLIVKSESLWKEACERQWPGIITSDQYVFTDKLQLATALNENNNTNDSTPNYSLLLSLATDKNPPSCIDESLLPPCKWSKKLKRHRPVRATEDNTAAATTISNLDLIDSTTVQYSGAVRQGDRCIRANHPLPRPQLLSVVQQAMVAPEKSLFEKMTCLSNCYWNDSSNTQKTPIFRPFVSPFLSNNKENQEIQLTPRLISYYEVTILESTDMSKLVKKSNAPRPFSLTPQFTTEKVSEECISIGLALDEFQIHARMPGWDTVSFGFHGDDGGIYHGSGHMIQDFGTTFGPGDTVGCGVDYHKQAMFFTKNGEFLGYAYEGLMDDVIHQDLYPVVGMDSNYPVTCNFGTEHAFRFDFTSLLLEQQEIVQKTIMLEQMQA